MKKLILLFIILLICVPCFAATKDVFSYDYWKKNEGNKEGQIANLNYAKGFKDGWLSGQGFARDEMWSPKANAKWIKSPQDAYNMVKEVYSKPKYRVYKTWEVYIAVLMTSDRTDLYKHLDDMLKGRKK
jgi:hypothetical protein